ncbi:peptidylprolyl isomerase [Paenibacillus sp. FSL H7-0716]|uniref:Peptidylprolyl isomerase n=1 Tax=Paenibacillus odorifer TaxID=189426 RepID=A0A1R0YSA2_9BACL|nr:peptidylprolyl isomerase [Paenibacillus odorifer]AWV31196.1 peptidylprolyl isomerase [Paenibacillus odorifer]OME09765.1 peptidylprolyl isomerase [Paenibacillus odorifer]OME11754.1 peptidylprolyl isomerase [Paenibacillus odorifer]
MSLNKTKSWKVLLVSLAAAVSFSMLAACGNSADDNQAVATYKGGTITQKEFAMDQKIMKFLSPQQAQYLEIDAFKESILKQEVGFEYLASQATDEAKKQAEKEADTQIASIKEQLGDTYKKTLKDADVTEKDIRTYMERVLTVYQDMLLKVTDDQVVKEFEATKGDFTVATLRHVLIGLTDADNKERTSEEALKIAKEVKAKLDGGADFAAIAKEYSDDTGSKEAGGEYKDKAVGTYVEEFKKAAQTLPLNTVSDPVETSYGYHIIKVESRTDKTFDQLTDEQKEGIKSSIVSKNLETFMEKDLEGIIENINLPKSSAAADETGTNSGTEATTAPSASPSASPSATDAAE